MNFSFTSTGGLTITGKAKTSPCRPPLLKSLQTYLQGQATVSHLCGGRVFSLNTVATVA